MSNRLKFSLLAIIFIIGYTCLSFELIILKQIINFVGSNTLITSVVISFVLFFLSLGYYIGSTISFARHSIRRLCFYIMCVLTLWYIFACSYQFINIIFYIMIKIKITSSLVQTFIISTLLLIAPSIGLGFVTSSIGRIIHHFNPNYTGRFMAVDTIGSVAGSLVTTLILMPLIGLFAASVGIIFLTAVAILLITKNKKIYLKLKLISMIALVAFVILNEHYIFNNQNLKLDNAVARIEIFDIDFANEQPQSKLMLINNSNSSKISSKRKLMFPYLQFIEDNYFKNLPKEKTHNILVLGAGGFTLGLNDNVNNYVYVDVVKELKDISEKYFLKRNLGSNKNFVFQDAYLYMLKNETKFDIIIVDLFSSKQSIPENFVTYDFFNMVKNNLTDDGIMLLNVITSAAFKNNFSRRIDNTLRSVFKHSLSRQVIYNFNPYQEVTYRNMNNIIYTFYNGSDDNTIYTIDKNSAAFGQ